MKTSHMMEDVEANNDGIVKADPHGENSEVGCMNQEKEVMSSSADQTVGNRGCFSARWGVGLCTIVNSVIVSSSVYGFILAVDFVRSLVRINVLTMHLGSTYPWEDTAHTSEEALLWESQRTE
ncbi:hypothetical protein HOY82DRAFT_618561 [Tuber indicum]|nr:hypothetical protein HOY82DRAFT_618561 [Tuber indicum]